MACGANMKPETFAQGKWFSERTMIIRVAAADVSTCRSKGPDGVEVQRMYDYVVACNDFWVKLRKVEVVDDYDSRPHKLVRSKICYQVLVVLKCLRLRTASRMQNM